MTAAFQNIQLSHETCKLHQQLSFSIRFRMQFHALGRTLFVQSHAFNEFPSVKAVISHIFCFCFRHYWPPSFLQLSLFLPLVFGRVCFLSLSLSLFLTYYFSFLSLLSPLFPSLSQWSTRFYSTFLLLISFLHETFLSFICAPIVIGGALMSIGHLWYRWTAEWLLF